jgi:hypothetical protein
MRRLTKSRWWHLVHRFENARKMKGIAKAHHRRHGFDPHIAIKKQA